VVQRLMQRESGFMETVDPETKQPTYTGYRAIGAHGWGILVDIPLRVLTAPLRETLGWLLPITLLAVMLGGYGGYRWALQLEAEKVISLQLRAHTRDLAALNEDMTILNQQLAVASDAKSDFLASMSHELRTPLNSIIGFSQILEDGLTGELNDKQKEYIGYVLASGNHLLALINDILDVAKIEAGKAELEVSPFPLRSALEGAVASLTDKAEARRLSLTLVVTPDADIDILADERRFRQIALNLLSNAVKFTPEGGAVTVKAQRFAGSELAELAAGDYVEIAVTDTGIGISAADQAKLFQPFSQLKSGLSKNVSGTGLGLALTKKLVEMHGGAIWLQSEPGRGSTFTFVLPVKSLTQ
jgi:signal transduction histidine kinase